jgi:hypothetical protein
LTMFSGFPFGRDHPFTYLEGKRVLGLALGELRNRRDLLNGLGMNPKAVGRSAITGRQADAVWDFLSLSAALEEDSFTKHPHLTLGIGSQAVDAMVTVPNAVNNAMRKNLVKLGEAGFQALATDIVNNLKPLLQITRGQRHGAGAFSGGIPRRGQSHTSMQGLISTCARQFRPVGRPRHSRDGCPPVTAPSSTKKAQTTRFKWAWCFAMSTAPSFGKPMRLI